MKKLPRTEKITSLTALALSMLATSASAQGQVRPRLEQIQVESNVPEVQYWRIAQDLNTLKAHPFNKPDPEMLRLMELQDSSPQSLLDWLQARVHYLVSEKFSLSDDNVTVVDPFYSFANPDVFPNLEMPKKIPSDIPPQDGSETPPQQQSNENAEPPKTVMRNIGGSLYFMAKSNGALFAVDIDGIGQVKTTSPRMGIIQVGEGMFAFHFKKPEGKNRESMAGIGFRLETLFHEARHSDGNGKSLAFLHVTCPEGHDYAGYAACDRNLNGPYMIGTRFLRSMARSCQDCTLAEREQLSLLVLDNASRTLRAVPNPLANPDSSKTPMIPSVDWDATPEGTY